MCLLCALTLDQQDRVCDGKRQTASPLLCRPSPGHQGQHPSCMSATAVAEESEASWVAWVSVNFIAYFCCHLELAAIERILRKGSSQRQPVETAVVSF